MVPSLKYSFQYDAASSPMQSVSEMYGAAGPAGPVGPPGPATVLSEPGGPLGPAGPGTVLSAPGGPDGPAGPGTVLSDPAAPWQALISSRQPGADPALPGEPTAPGGPVGPAGPLGPAEPGGPDGPMPPAAPGWPAGPGGPGRSTISLACWHRPCARSLTADGPPCSQMVSTCWPRSLVSAFAAAAVSCCWMLIRASATPPVTASARQVMKMASARCAPAESGCLVGRVTSSLRPAWLSVPRASPVSRLSSILPAPSDRLRP